MWSSKLEHGSRNKYLNFVIKISLIDQINRVGWGRGGKDGSWTCWRHFFLYYFMLFLRFTFKNFVCAQRAHWWEFCAKRRFYVPKSRLKLGYFKKFSRYQHNMFIILLHFRRAFQWYQTHCRLINMEMVFFTGNHTSIWIKKSVPTGRTTSCIMCFFIKIMQHGRMGAAVEVPAL